MLSLLPGTLLPSSLAELTSAHLAGWMLPSMTAVFQGCWDELNCVPLHRHISPIDVFKS